LPTNKTGKSDTRNKGKTEQRLPGPTTAGFLSFSFSTSQPFFGNPSDLLKDIFFKITTEQTCPHPT
jgi:hypothetical protein